MDDDYIEREFKVLAGNVRRNGAKLFEMVQRKILSSEFRVSSSENKSQAIELATADVTEGDKN